jgi:sulfur carrier protein ThiS adenylyltransferase
MRTHKVVFACVDSIDVRRHIWSVIQFRDAIFIDGRMAAEVMRIISVSDSSSRLQYRTTLFSEQEALRQACTARSTLYCANIAAGLMVSQFTQWLRDITPEFDVMLNLLSLDLVVKASVTDTTVDIATPT